jgi:phosphoglycerol transferase MdoB-like AlkP superfamily enzyme
LKVGERQIVVPQCSPDKLPNIVLVLLESVSYSVTPLSDSKLDTMPHLARLTQEGVEFRRTYAPVSHTTKAFWATLTSTTPVIRGDYVEAIPMIRLYEGLPTILAKVGYRSAFFEMSRGSFECA